MQQTPDCPSQQAIDDLLQGKLKADSSERVAGHLETCARCTTLADALRHDDAFTQEVRRAANTPEDLPAELAAVLSSVRHAVSQQTEALRLEDVQALLAPAQTADELGRLGPYRLLSKLGEGGMGIVYLAEHVQLKRQVALKVLRPTLAERESARQRFLAEAQAMAAIRHERVVTVHDVSGDTALPYLAMELLEGEPLDHWLIQTPRPTPLAIVRIGRQIAEGLAAAHARGTIHRDIKPSNIWLESPTTDGAFRVKILDFGLARPVHDNVHITAAGTILGTPAFMSPEQAAGGAINERSDLFSLGSVLHVLTTGNLPFAGSNTIATLSALANLTPPSVHTVNPGVPKRLSALIARLMSKSPDGRPAAATAVVEELAALEAELTQPARQKRPATQRWLVGAAVAACLLVAAGVVIRIRTKDGKEIEIPVPPGAKVEIVENKDGAAAVKPLPAGAVSLDRLRRADIPLEELLALGRGDPQRVPAELVAILGDSRLQHMSAVYDVVFSPDGKHLASVGIDGVRLWDAVTHQLVRRLGRWEASSSDQVAFSPDSKWIACTTWKDGSSDLPRSVVLLAEVATGDTVKLLAGLESPITQLAFSPNGKHLAASGKAVLKIWDVVAGQETYSHTEPPGEGNLQLTSVVFSSDSKWLATSATSGMVRVRAADTGKEVCRLDHAGWCHQVAFSPDNKVLASIGADRLRLWETSGWKELPELALLKGVNRTIAFRPDGKMLVAGGQEERQGGYLRFWSWPEARELRTLRSDSLGSSPSRLAFAPAGKTLAVSSPERAISLWDPETGTERTTRSRPGHVGAVMGLAVTPDGRTLISGDREGTVRLWDLSAAAPQPRGNQKLLSTRLKSLDLSPDGKAVAVTNDTGSARLLTVADGKQHDLPGMGDALFVAGGVELLGTVGSGVARCDARRGQIVHTWPVTPLYPRVLALSPDGRLAASVHEQGEVKVWDATTGQVKYTLPRGVVGSRLRFSPDSTRLALGGSFQLHLWDVVQAKTVFQTRIQGSVQAVAFSPDGKQLASLTQSGVIQLWDGATDKPLRTIRLGTTGVLTWPLLFSPEGRHLLVGNPNGTVFVLRLAAPVQ